MISRAIGYVRVSTEEQAAGGKTSPSTQRAAIEAKATIIEKWFEDLGASAFKDKERPGFTAMVKWCKANPTKGGEVWAYNHSRFSRKETDETAYYRHILKLAGWAVYYCVGDDIEDPTGRAIARALHDAQAHADSVGKADAVRDGKRAAAKQGFCPTKTPYGYLRRIDKNGVPGRVLPRGEQKPPDVQTRPYPEGGPESPTQGEEQTNVEWMFEIYAKGEASLHDLGDAMRRRDPGGKWTHGKVRNIITNPAYFGTYVAQKGAVVLFNNHPLIVSRALWHQCQARLYINSQQRRAVKGDYKLTGLLRCEQCGGNIVCVGGATGWKRYGCGNAQRGDGGCDGNTTITVQILEAFVIDAVASVAASEETARVMAEELEALVSHENVTTGSQLQAVERERGKLETKRNRLVRAIGDGALTAAEAATELDPIRDRLEELEAESQRLRFAQRRPESLKAQREELLASAMNIRQTLETATGAQARELIRPWIEGGVVSANPRAVTLRIRRIPLIGALKILEGSLRERSSMV